MRHHLELQTGWKSFISNTRCGHKFGFLLSQTNRVKRKYLISHIFTGHTWELSNKKKKSAREVDLSGTAFPEFQMWTANSECDHWSLVSWLLVVCSYMLSETKTLCGQKLVFGTTKCFTHALSNSSKCIHYVQGSWSWKHHPSCFQREISGSAYCRKFFSKR